MSQWKCKICGKDTNSKYRTLCDKHLKEWTLEHCKNNSKKANEIRWKNHQYCYRANGYIMIKVKDHPFANKRGYVYQHRLIMEKNLKRYLTPEEIVHHKDGIKTNNDFSNLVMFRSTGEHTSYHLLRGEIVDYKNRRLKHGR